MTLPDDPQTPPYREPGIAEPVASQPVTSAPITPESAAVPPSPPAQTTGAEESRAGKGQKVKVAAVLAGAAAVANKIRQEAPKKVKQVREKRVAGRCVILTEVDGRRVAIGPYPDNRAASQDSGKMTAAPQVVELMSPTAYFGPQDDRTTTPPDGR